MHQIERGKSEGSISVMRSITEKLGCLFDDILGEQQLSQQRLAEISACYYDRLAQEARTVAERARAESSRGVA